MFTGAIKPSRTCIGVAALPGGTDVEITATALLRTGGKMTAISSAAAPPPAPFLSSAIGTDELVFVSGSCGVKDGKFIDGTVQDRTTLALKNVEALLKEEGLDLGDGASPSLLAPALGLANENSRGRDPASALTPSLRDLLARPPARPSAVVTSTVYLSKYTTDFADMNKAYVAAFPAEIPKGCRTCIGVANLPAGTDVEITITAARRGKVATPPSPAGAWASEAVLCSKAGLYYVSGAVGDHVGKDAGVKAHTTAALETITKRLEAVGLGLDDLVAVSECRVPLADLRGATRARRLTFLRPRPPAIYLSNYKEDFAQMNEAYTAVLKAPFPSRTCIGVRPAPSFTLVGRPRADALADRRCPPPDQEPPARHDGRDPVHRRSQGLVRSLAHSHLELQNLGR